MPFVSDQDIKLLSDKLDILIDLHRKQIEKIQELKSKQDDADERLMRMSRYKGKR